LEFALPLLKSLLCLQGVDNGRRFLAINLSSYILIAAFSSLIALSNLILILFCLFCLPLVAAAGIRRVRDAHFKLGIAAIPVITFVATLLLLSFAETPVRWFVLLLSLVVTLAFAMLNNAQVNSHKLTKKYILGYAGPVDLAAATQPTPFQHSYHERIEPVIQPHLEQSLSDDLAKNSTTNGLGANSADVSNDALIDEIETSSFNQQGIEQHDINPSRGSQSYKNIYQNPRERDQSQSFLAMLNIQAVKQWYAQTNSARLHMVIGIIAAISLVSIAIFWPSAEDQIMPNQLVNQVETSSRQRLNKIEMPDSFWLMHDQHNAITLAWQGETVAKGQVIKEGDYWSALTAVGDKSCAELVFSRDSRFRSQQVVMKNQGDYYADFSPVDSKAIIEAIALKSRFNLCGYEFSLKGTQAILMSHKKYADYLIQ
jgi:hypothetical protein